MFKAKESLLTTEQLEVCRIFREKNAICEFLEQLCSPKNKPLKLPQHEKALLRALWYYNFMYWCASRRVGKTFCIGKGLAAILGMITGLPETHTFGVVSGSMRQVSLDFDETIQAVDNSPFLQSITIKGPKLTQDHYIWELRGWEDNEGTYYKGHQLIGLPLGAQKGSTMLRGLGVTTLVIDEFTLVPESSYQSLLPISATSRDPMKDVEAAIDRKTKGDNIITSSFDPAHSRLVFASTAGYEFQPAYRVFSAYLHNTRITIEANQLLSKLRSKYPGSAQYDMFYKCFTSMYSHFPLEVQEHYRTLLRLSVDNIASNSLVHEYIDYLRDVWEGYKYLAVSLPMTVAPTNWFNPEKMQSIFTLLTPAEVEMEFYAKWQKDSSGFFRESVLQSITDISIPVEMKGDIEHTYIIGIDPTEVNKLGIVVLKIIDHLDHKSVRVVYAREHDATKEHIGHPQQVKLLFDILNAFPNTTVIMLDQGGGGKAISDTSSEQHEPFTDLWGEYNQPLLNLEDPSISKKGARLIWTLQMDNNTVLETNRKIMANAQIGRFTFSGKLPEIAEEDVYFSIDTLKKQMSRLVLKPIGGSQVKVDLPTERDDPSHIHDLWSALTLAYRGFIEYAEGDFITLNQRKSRISLGFWGTAKIW